VLPARTSRLLARAVALVLTGSLAAACSSSPDASKGTTTTSTAHRRSGLSSSSAATTASGATSTSGTTPTTLATSTSGTTPTTLAVGLVRGMTAIGDSVMVDYASALVRDLPGINVQAAVSRQWSAGIAEVASLRSKNDLGATVVIGLGTNGPVTHAAFRSMMAELGGVQRVVFVTVFVDQPWQGEVNATLAWGASQYRNVVLADWASLAAHHRSWLYADGTHLPIGGAGAIALATLVARAARVS
jgi:hypothetical protein